VRLFDGEVSVKDMIEAAGVPHTEVDLVIVNRESVDFTYADAHLGRLARYLRLLGFKKRLVLRGKTFSLHLSANTHHSGHLRRPGVINADPGRYRS
jgi:hypothetical protein